VGHFRGDYSTNIREYTLSQKLIFVFARIAQPYQFTNTNIHHSGISIIVVFSSNNTVEPIPNPSSLHRHGNSN
jgi:hypothetical protein